MTEKQKKVQEKKRILIELAQNGAPKPKRRGPSDKTKHGEHQLACALSNYRNTQTDVYDEDFDKLITQLRPDWEPKRRGRNRTKEKQDALIKMALEDRERPKQTQEIVEGGFTSIELYNALYTYTSVDNTGFDPEFSLIIMKYKPFWLLWERGLGMANK